MSAAVVTPHRTAGRVSTRALVPVGRRRAQHGASSDTRERGVGRAVFCGVDWAENLHDVAVVDDRGQLLAKRRIGDDAAGFRVLLELLAEHGDTPAKPIPGAMATSRALLVAFLVPPGPARETATHMRAA